jgi:hypothetical protein
MVFHFSRLQRDRGFLLLGARISMGDFFDSLSEFWFSLFFVFFALLLMLMLMLILTLMLTFMFI